MQASTPSAAPPIDVAALRESEFPHVGRAPYLNAASVGPLPERARRAVDAANFRRSSIHDLAGDDFEPTLQRARAAAARLIGAEPDEIALQPNTTHGINLAAHLLPIERGQRVVVSGLEFPANVFPWMRLEREGRARVTVVPPDALGRPDEARIREEMDRGDVAVFALSSVQFATGWNADLVEWGRFCAERGIFFVVDAIQSLGQVPTDVRAAGVDILAAGGQKWLCSPWGTGFAYVRRELVRRLEPEVVGWTAMSGAGDLTDQCGYRYELLDSARRFEVSTMPWQDFAGFAQSVGLLLETGIDRIRGHVLGLLDPLVEWLRETGGGEVTSDLHPARRSGVFAFRPADPAAAFRAVHRAGIVCSLREGSIRLSPHLYSTPDDVGAVIDVLAHPERW